MKESRSSSARYPFAADLKWAVDEHEADIAGRVVVGVSLVHRESGRDSLLLRPLVGADRSWSPYGVRNATLWLHVNLGCGN